METEKTTGKEDPGGIILKGLSKYRIFDDGDGIRVCSNYSASFMKPRVQYSHRGKPTQPIYRLRTDSGKQVAFTVGSLRFLIRHREIPAELTVGRRTLGLVILEDGTIAGRGEVELIRSIHHFKSMDDVLMTVLLMMQAKETPWLLYDFARENERMALTYISRRFGIPYAYVQEEWDEGVRLFVKNVTEGNFQKVIPLHLQLINGVILALGKKRKRTRTFPIRSREISRFNKRAQIQQE